MSRRMKEKEDAGSVGASIARASGKLRNIFGKVQWRRKVATLLAAAMMTGTISDGLSMANLTGAGTVYASSSNAQREEDPGGQPVRKGDSASDYYLEEAKEDLDLQLNAASLKAAMESEEPIQLDLQYLPFEDEAVLVGAYDEIISKTEGYRLLEQGVLQDDEGKVTYLVFGKEGEKSSSWMDNLKVIVLNGNQQTEENPGYNISFTIEGDDLTLTEGQVEIRTFPSAVREEQENAPAVSAPSGNAGNAQPSGGGSGLESSDSEEETTAAETGATAVEEETTAVETGATAVEEETTAAETEAAAEEETTAAETEAAAEEETETAAEKETEAAAEEETEAAAEKETEAASEKETGAEEDNETNLSWNPSGSQLSISRYTIWNVTATASNAKRREFTGDAESTIADIRQALSDSGRGAAAPTAEGKYTFTSEEVDAINMVESDSGISLFSLLGAFGGSGEVRNTIVSPGYSISYLSGQTRSTGPLDYAEQLYGNKVLGDELEYPVMAVSPYVVWADGSRPENVEKSMKAGEFFQLYFEMAAKPAATYGYNGDDYQPLYDQVESSWIYFWLPEGMVPEGNNIEGIKTENSQTLYRVTNGKSIATSGGETFHISVHLEGNGTLAAGEDFPINLEAWSESIINAIDRTTGDTKKFTVQEYCMEYSLDVQSEVDEKWGISKELIKAAGQKEWTKVTGSDGKDYVQLQYKLNVGLLNQGRIVSDSSYYWEEGRTTFTAFSVEDTITVTGKTDLMPSSVTAVMGEDQDAGLIWTSGTNTFTLKKYMKQGFEEASGNPAVAEVAPAYTTYTITVTYPYEEFLLAYDVYDRLEKEGNKDTYLVTNNAELTYTLNGLEEEKAKADPVETVVRDRIDPVVLRIEKNIQNASSGAYEPYTTAKQANHPGQAVFTIEYAEKGTGEYQSYEKINFVKNYSGSVVMVNPEKDSSDKHNDYETGDDGYVAIYLEPGYDYRITETRAPENTMAAAAKTVTSEDIAAALENNTSITLTFDNELSGQGGIKFRKGARTIGANGTETQAKALNGIQFGLFRADETEFTVEKAVQTATSDASGYVTFYPVEASQDGGTQYIVREVGNEGKNYYQDPTSYTVTVESGEIATLNVTEKDPDNGELAQLYNEINNASVTLTKLLQDDNGVAQAVPSGRRGEFSKAFQLQKNDNGSWENVGTAQSLTTSGTDARITWESIQRRDQVTGEYISYRIVETLPDGYSVAESGNQVDGEDASISKPAENQVAIEFTFEPGSDNKLKNTAVTLVNTGTGRLTVNKQVWDYSSTAASITNATNAAGYTIGLFTKEGTDYTLVATAKTSAGKAQFTGLPVFDENGQKKNYYLGELIDDKMSGYLLYGKATDTQAAPPVTVGQEQYYILDTPVTLSTTSTKTSTIYNVQQKIPYWITKTDSKGNYLSGASVTVKLGEETVAENQNVPSGGKYLLLDMGKGYTAEETKVPTNYLQADPISFTTPNETITPANMQTILSQKKVGETSLVSTIVNKRKPQAGITKLNQDGKQIEVTFTVYRKTDDGSFESAAKTITTSASGTSKITLDPGTYYFRENVSAAYMNPDKMTDEQLNAAVTGQIDGAAAPGWVRDAEDQVYFGPYELKEDDDAASLFTLTNKANSGRILATKVRPSDNSGSTVLMEGAEFTLTWTEGDKDMTKTVTSTASEKAVTGDDGKSYNVVFDNLKVRDTDGEKITYTLTETKAPDGYEKSEKSFTIQLTEEKDTAQTQDGTSLNWINVPLVHLSVSKTWTDKWQEMFARDGKPASYYLPGVEIALFRVPRDASPDTLAEYVAGATTDADGAAIFRSVPWGDENGNAYTYYMAEVQLPASPEGLVMPNDAVPLPDGYESAGTENSTVTITKGDLDSKYNAVSINPEPSNESSVIQGGQGRQDERILDNPKPYLRFDVLKLCAWEATAEMTEEQHYDQHAAEVQEMTEDGEDWTAKYEYIAGRYYEKVNGAKFALYSIAVDQYDGSAIGAADIKANWTLVNTYESGAVATNDGSASGHIITEPVERGLVYALVETAAAPGYQMPAQPVMMIFYPNGSGINVSQDGTQGVAYDPVNGGTYPGEQGFIQNPHAVGGGGGIYYANLKFNKWSVPQESIGDPAEYKPLGSARFDLYLLDENDNRVTVTYNGEEIPIILQKDIITGLENNPAASSERTANALSRTINVAAPYQDLNRTATEVNDINELLQKYIQSDTDDQGKEYKEIRVELVETYAPNGYNTERESYITTLRAYKNAWNLITQEGNVNREYFYEYDPETGESTGEAILNSFYVDVEVVFNDYGFRPDNDDVDHTLTNAAAGAVTTPISGGRYLLERYDSASQKFVPYEAAGEDGIFTITGGTAAMGLKTGQYRLTELSAAGGYQMSYDDNAAMIFNVGYSKKIIDLYHPEKPDLTVIKETWRDDPSVDLSGITFTLKKGSDSLKAVTKAVNDSYQAEFADLESGTYTLSEETLPADSPVTDAYFTAQTVHAGYTYTYSAEDGEKVFGELAEGKGIFMAPELTVRNPRRGDLTIQKSDPERSGATFASVTFKVEYQKFAENAQGDGYDTVTKPASWTGTNVKTETVTITNESSRTLEGRDPGWYRITETTAPDGYTKSEGPVVVALTADMGITDEFTERVVIENRKQVSFTLIKELDFGSLRAEEQEAAVKALSGFTFAVYEGSWDASTLTLSSPVKKASLTVQNFTKAGDTYQASSTINLDQLADGKVYAIRETQVNGWTLLPEINGADATTATVGNARYLILDELDFNQSKTDLRVTVENRYDKGTIVITKVDAANQTKLLSGAEFTLYDAAGTTKIGTFNEILNDAGEGTGEYAITVPASAEGTAYIIKETKAPENYVNTVPETGISVTVTPGATVTKDTNSALQITNLSGIDLVIKKYGEEKEKATETNTLSGASFTLYRKEKAGTDWTKVGTYTTGASGTVSVAGLDVANYDYAVSENPVSQYSRYKLDSMEIGVAQSDEFTPIDLTGEAPYSLGSLTAGNRYQLNVYNAKPEILSISKTWEDGRTDSKAYVTVYNTNGTQDTTDDTAEYTDLQLTASAVAVALQPGTYRIVETKVEGSDGYVLNPDDAGREKIVELENGVGTKSVALVNEKPDMELTLTKDSETAGLGNLWWQEADVTYTVAPSVTNSLPLTSYQLTESGLTMWIADGSGQKEITDSTPEYAQYVKNRYSITSIELDQVTDNLTGDPYGTGNLKGAECSLNTITASVTAYDFDGNPVGEAATVPVSSADVTARTVTFGSTPKIKYVTVSYEDITLKNSGINTGKEDGQKYVLGANFHPGSMKVTVHLDQQNAKDSEGAYLQQIEKVTNKAAAEMHYMLPDGEGVLTADSDSAVAVKDIRITEQAAPVVSFDKAVDKSTGVNPNNAQDKLVTYTLRLHNTKTEGETGLALENPIVIDALPLGMNYLGYTAEVTKYADGSEGESELTEGTAVNLVDPDSGRRNIVISFAGDLLPGEVLTVTLKTEVTGQALAYGYTLQNLAYATSGKTLQATGTNPYGASFKVTNASETDWAKEGLSGKEEILDTVKEASYGSNGYIRAQANSSMYLSDALYPFKEARGNRDSLFQTGTSTVTMITQEEGEQPADNGQVEFRLNLLNGSSDTDVTQLRVIDVIPNVNEINGEGTVRGSAFALQMTGKPAITMMGGTDLPAGTIVQYYVTTEAYTADRVDAVKDYLAYTAGNPGTGWTIADGNTDWTEVRAFIADIQNTQIKGTMNGASEGEGVQITYMTQIDPEMTLTEKNEVAFKLAQNDFTIQYKGRPSSNPSGEEAAVKLPRTSAKIYVKLLPTTVSVGGNVWIDADGDGRQDESSTATSETNLFNQMKDTLSISLNKYRGSTYDTVTANGDAEAYPDAYFNKAVYAQNEFRFSDLEPALPQTGKTLYDGDGNLVVNALTGADPATYELLVQTSSLPASLAGITLKLTAPVRKADGTENIRGHYSLDPRESAGGNAITDQERYDSNFEGNYGSSATRRFFLWSTTADLTDMTKDIGFVPYRDSFTIEKKDEAGHPLEGVSFTIYGPFAPDTAGSKTAADLNTANTVWSGETDGNGRIVLDDQLLYLMDYIIVEDEALDGYTLDDAEADGFDPISISGKTGWILPAGTVSESGTQDAEGNALYQPKITVINSYEKGSLKLAKVDSTDADEMLAGAKFTLEATPVTENGVADSTFAGSAAEFVAKVTDTSWQTAAGVSGVTASSTDSSLTMEFTLDSGSADFGQILPRGNYTLTETKAPAGYTGDSTPKSFTIDKDGDQADFTGGEAIQNDPQEFALKKITEENGEPLSGAKFNLYRAEDTGKTDPLWGSNGKTTGSDGLITFTMTGLSANTPYVLSETAAPSGYAPLGSDIPFKLVPESEGSSELKAELTSNVSGVALDEGKTIVTIEVTNQLNTGSITLSKELIGEVTDPISRYGDTFTFTLKLQQPYGYRNPVLKSAHVTDGQGNLTHVNAVKTSPSGTTNLELPIGADGTVTGIQLKKDESLTISGIYYGTTYTVTEDQGVSTGFAFAGAVVQNGTDAAQPVNSHPVTGTTVTGKDVSITIQNQVKKATVTLTKTFDSDIPDTMPTFQIYDITSHAADPYESADDAVAAEKVTDGEITITWNNEEKEGTGTSKPVLIPGHTYQIVEILDPNDDVSAGYTAKVSGPIAVTVGSNNVLVVNPSVVAMENNRSKGWISVSKILKDYDGNTISEARTFYYSIFRVENGVEAAIDLGSHKIDAEHPTIGAITNTDQAHVHFVDFGTYRIAEVDEAGNKVTTASSLEYQVTNPADIVVELDNEANNTFSGEIVNQEKPLGSITVTKKADYARAETSFYFLVEDESGRYIDMDGHRQTDKADAIWTITADQAVSYDNGDMVEIDSHTVTGIPYGTYTVTEVDASGNALPSDYAYAPSYTVKVGDGAEGSGSAGTINLTNSSMTVTVSNTVGRVDLEMVKTFDDEVPADENLPSFAVYHIEDVNDPITSAEDAESMTSVGTMEIRNENGTYKGSLTGQLIPGYSYQAVEILKTDEISKLYDPWISEVFTADENGDGITLAVKELTAENERQRGYLQVKKTLENVYGEITGTGRTFYYIVRDADGNAIDLPEGYRADMTNKNVGIITANAGTAQVIPVEFGTYTVYETDKSGNVYDTNNPNPAYEVTNPDPVTIGLNNADVTDPGTLVEIKNTEKNLGELTVTKETDYADAGSSFYFLVEDGRGQYLKTDGTLVPKASLASASEAVWTIEAEDAVDYKPDAQNEGHGVLQRIGSITVEEIPYGTYTVTEVDETGSKLGESFAYEVSAETTGAVPGTADGGTGEIDLDHPSMTVTVTNRVKKTHLTIEKIFDSHVPDAENLPEFAIYQLADADTPITSAEDVGSGNVQVATMSIASRSDATYGGETGDILIPGYSYQAVEILKKDEISRLYDPIVSDVMTVTLEPDGAAVNALSWTAENIRNYGYLTVTKELFDHYGEAIDDTRTFYYRIRDVKNGGYLTIEPEYRPNAELTEVAEITTAEGDQNIHFVKYGTYEIVETDENGNVYDVSESWLSGLLGKEANPIYIVENPDAVEINLNNADTASASIANRERALGELTIIKETDWAERGQTEFYFTVKNEGTGELLDAPVSGLGILANLFKSEEARKIWTITADRTTDTMAEVGRLTIGELPYGIYTVTEVDQNGNALSDEYPYTVSYQVEVSGKDAVSSADKGQGELDYQHPSMTVTVTNTRNKGYLTVRKNLQDYQGNTLTGTGRQFYFTVLDEDGNAVELPEEFRYEGQQHVGWITDNTSRELFLPYGTYRVLETDEEGQPYDAQNENLLYEVTTPDAVELSLANADSAEAVIVNKEKTIGSLTVTKRVNRTANGTTFYFIVTNSKGERMPMPDENGNPTEETIWRISASQNVMTDTAIGSLTLKNLPYDTYTVTEVRENGEALADSYIYNVSYETTAQGVTASGQSGTITIDARDMAVTVTNTRKTGGGSGDGDGGGGGGSDGGGGGSTITVTTDVPTASITDPGIPLSPYPGDGSVIIPEGEVPLFGLPKTGDNSISAAGLAGIMLAALLSACGIIRKRKKEEES